MDKYAPGNHPGSVLKELRRRGNVELVEPDIIRFKTLTTRTSGATEANVAVASRRMKRLGETLFQNILDTQQSQTVCRNKTHPPDGPKRLRSFGRCSSVAQRRFFKPSKVNFARGAPRAFARIPRRSGSACFPGMKINDRGINRHDGATGLLPSLRRALTRSMTARCTTHSQDCSAARSKNAALSTPRKMLPRV